MAAILWRCQSAHWGLVIEHDVRHLDQHGYGIIMSAMSSQTTSLTIVYSTVYSGADQRKHQSYASLAFVRGIHRWPVNSPHKGPVTRKWFSWWRHYGMALCGSQAIIGPVLTYHRTPRRKLQWNYNQNANFPFNKMHLKKSSAKWRPCCSCLNLLRWAATHKITQDLSRSTILDVFQGGNFVQFNIFKSILNLRYACEILSHNCK